jgi:hypothetical protein
MLRRGFAIGIVALACALPASASAATQTSHQAIVGATEATVVVPVVLKEHPRLKAHRLVSLELRQLPRLK